MRGLCAAKSRSAVRSAPKNPPPLNIWIECTTAPFLDPLSAGTFDANYLGIYNLSTHHVPPPTIRPIGAQGKRPNDMICGKDNGAHHAV